MSVLDDLYETIGGSDMIEADRKSVV